MRNLRLFLTLLFALAAVIGLWTLTTREPAPEEVALAPDRGVPENSYLQVRHRIRDPERRIALRSRRRTAGPVP